jgi:F0F1-type ATP synthase membrane subunit b/b'
MDFVGNISLRLVGLLVTVGTLAAIYFFAIKPATDTANNAFHSISGPLREAERQAARAQRQLQHNATGGSTSSKISLSKIQKCISGAGNEAKLLERCAKRFGP